MSRLGDVGLGLAIGLVAGALAATLARESRREYVRKRESWTEVPPADRGYGWDRIRTAQNPSATATVSTVQVRPTHPRRT